MYLKKHWLFLEGLFCTRSCCRTMSWKPHSSLHWWVVWDEMRQQCIRRRYMVFSHKIKEAMERKLNIFIGKIWAVHNGKIHLGSLWCLMLCELKVPNIWREVRFTHCLCFWHYVLFLNQMSYYIICFYIFLTEIQMELCNTPSIPNTERTPRPKAASVNTVNFLNVALNIRV